MSKPLVTLAALLIAVAGLAPIVIMATRVSGPDLVNILDERTWSLLERTLLLGLGAAAVAVVIGAPFGYLIARTDLPLRGVFRPLGVVPLLLPPLMMAMTWAMISDLRGAPATILLLGFCTFPLVSLFVMKGASQLDAARSEAALLVGGKRAVLRMELPLLLPCVLCGACLAFVFAINDFAVPDYVSSVGRKFNVYADEVFASWKVYGETGRAVATSLPLVALTLASLIPALALRRRGALATYGSGFRRAAPLALGAWRWPLFGAVLAVVVVTVGIPIGRLFFEAGGGARGWTTEAFRAAFARALELGRDNLQNSLVISIVAATACVPIGLILGHALERARFGRVLELVCVLPIAVPAILFGIGNIALWNHGPTADFYNSSALVILLLAGRFVIFPILAGSGSVAQLDPHLEESARLSGAGPASRLARIVAPSVWPSLVGGWTLVFVLSMRELDAAILVPAANNTVMFRVFNAVHFGRDDFVAALALIVVFFIVLPGLTWSLFTRRRMEVLP